MNRSALLRRPPVLQAAAAVLLTSAFMLPAARAQAAETADKASTGQASASPAPLTKGEIKAQREFKMLDFNKDGKLSRTEVALFPRLSAAFDEATPTRTATSPMRRCRPLPSSTAPNATRQRPRRRPKRQRPQSMPQPCPLPGTRRKAKAQGTEPAHSATDTQSPPVRLTLGSE